MRNTIRPLAFLVVILVSGWLLGNLFLDVQLPDRSGRRQAFPDPMSGELSLRNAFLSLPDEGGENTRIRLLEKNEQAWLERWRLLAEAEETLDICYFILKQDIFGMAFLGHLVEKAHQGLEIRVLLDAMGTNMSRSFRGNDYLDTLVNTKRVVVKMYRPLPFRYLDAFLTLNPAAVLVSDHDKILLADSRWALVGGRNISKEYFAPLADDNRAFRDTDIVLFGPWIGKALETAFEAQFESGEAHAVRREVVNLKDSTADLLLAYRAMDAWLQGKPIPEELRKDIEKRGLPWLAELAEMPHLRGALEEPRPPREFAEVRLIDSRCRLLEADDFITRSLIRLVRSAREEILIQSPYLILPEEAVDVLAEAAARGVRITLLTNGPSSSDNAKSQGIFLEQWPEILARVPTLRLFVAADRHNLHGKLAAIDRRLALIGTYNLDPLSIALNSELVVAAWSEPFSRSLWEWREAMLGAADSPFVEYRILRRSDGSPQRDRDGRPVIAFGPADHLDLADYGKIGFYRRCYRWIWGMSRSYPLL